MISSTKDLNIINEFLKNFNTSIEEIGVFSNYLIYEEKDSVVGFLNYDLIYDRIEIDYIYVNPEYRKQGIASKLFKYMVENKKNIQNITLEVRKSNINAINFYKKHGFEEAATRENYYGSEDGILMVKEM